MALLPTKQRDQVMVLICALIIGLTGAYFVYVWQPKNTELADVQARLDTLTQINEKAKREVQRGSVAQLKRQSEEMARNLEVMRHLVPTSNEVPALLESVSTAARRAGLDLSDVTPQGVIPGDQFDTYKFRLGVTGPYHEVAQLLANVGSLQRIVTPMNLQLAVAQPRQASEMKPRRGEQLLDVKFEIQTYVVRTSTAPPSVAVTTAGHP
jgi:type IV pilus assembly protein PilO